MNGSPPFPDFDFLHNTIHFMLPGIDVFEGYGLHSGAGQSFIFDMGRASVRVLAAMGHGCMRSWRWEYAS
jgi:hypothetical protein